MTFCSNIQVSGKNTTGGAKGTVQDPTIFRGKILYLTGSIPHLLEGLVATEKGERNNNKKQKVNVKKGLPSPLM